MSNSRNNRRVHFSQNAAIEVHFEYRGIKHKLPLLDFSAQGARLDLKNDKTFSEGLLSKLPSPSENTFSQITILFGSDQIGKYPTAKIRWLDESSQQLGIEFVEHSAENTPRKSTRFELDTDLRPLISATDPIFAGEVLHFYVEDIGVNGLKMVGSLSNRHILKGAVLKGVHLFLPCVGLVQLDLEVAWVAQEDQKLAWGVTFLNVPKETTRDILQFILFSSYRKIQNRDELLQFLKMSEFQIKAFKKALRVRAINSETDRDQMKQLRWIAYEKAGKIAPGSSVETMIDSYDRYSTSFGVFLGQIMVGTFRFTPSTGPKEPFPFEAYISAKEVPTFERKGYCEVSKLAILPEIQNSDVLLSMFSVVARETVVSQCDIYLMATDQIKTHYLRLGATPMGKSVPHPVQIGEQLSLFKMGRLGSISGARSSGLTWHLALKGVYQFFSKKGLFPKKAATIRIAFRTWIERLILKRRKSKTRSAQL